MVIIPSSRGEVDRNDVDNTAARVAVTINKALNVVGSNHGDVTDYYQETCDGEVSVTSETDTAPDKQSFVKCISLFTERRSQEDNETDVIVRSTVGDWIQ